MLLAEIGRLNADPEVDAILVQLPLPGGIGTSRVLEAIDPAKDVDGFHPLNVGRLVQGKRAPVPCTPAGVMELLRRESVPLRGTRAVVLGRSDIVGKPMATLLTKADATVTVAHSKTRDLPAICREADLLVAAIGRPAFVTADFIGEGAVVIDVGINRIDTVEEVVALLPGRRGEGRGVRGEGVAPRRRRPPGGREAPRLALHPRPRRRRPAHDRPPPRQHRRPLPRPPRALTMLRVGLTGGIASGKSAVAARLARAGDPGPRRGPPRPRPLRARSAPAPPPSPTSSARSSSTSGAPSTARASPRSSSPTPPPSRASTPASTRSSASRPTAGSPSARPKVTPPPSSRRRSSSRTAAASATTSSSPSRPPRRSASPAPSPATRRRPASPSSPGCAPSSPTRPATPPATSSSSATGASTSCGRRSTTSRATHELGVRS